MLRALKKCLHRISAIGFFGQVHKDLVPALKCDISYQVSKLQIYSGFPNKFLSHVKGAPGSCTKVIWNLVRELKQQLRNDPNIFGFPFELSHLVWNLLSKHLFSVFKYQLGLWIKRQTQRIFNYFDYFSVVSLCIWPQISDKKIQNLN